MDESATTHEQVVAAIDEDPNRPVFDPDWRSPGEWAALRQAPVGLRNTPTMANVMNGPVDPTKPELDTGRTLGDDVAEEQRLAVSEFLKCLTMTSCSPPSCLLL